MSLISCNTFENGKCTSVYLIRHAEKIRTNENEKDPLLSEKGILRAQKWSEIFEKIEINKILSTDTKRTISTVIPTSEEKKIKIEIYRPEEITYESFMEENKVKKVLIVGHSNTIPETTNILIKNKFYNQIEDNNNSNLYFVNICDGIISHELLYFPMEGQITKDSI
jgi:phosphohistidine phosphatase SixA